MMLLVHILKGGTFELKQLVYENIIDNWWECEENVLIQIKDASNLTFWLLFAMIPLRFLICPQRLSVGVIKTCYYNIIHPISLLLTATAQLSILLWREVGGGHWAASGAPSLMWDVVTSVLHLLSSTLHTVTLGAPHCMTFTPTWPVLQSPAAGKWILTLRFKCWMCCRYWIYNLQQKTIKSQSSAE